MSTKHNSSELVTAWRAMHDGAGQALEWIADVRGKSKRLDAEADNLNRELHRSRNEARSLGRVSATPMSIGFFGLSQAGKSYLISALAADENGQLETDFGSHRLDFIKHVNPVGGGKEATGLITRFSGCSKPSPDPAYPIELRLFKEIEIAKILANSWFEDFDHERVSYVLTSECIKAVLDQFHGRDCCKPVMGVDADDVVSLWDYLESNYKKSVAILEATYWPQVLKLAPCLGVSDRAKLFSVLWGEIPELTNVYEKLAGALHRLDCAETVFAPLGALVTQKASEFVQANSIMNVDILNALNLNSENSGCNYSPDYAELEVRPWVNAELKNKVRIYPAELAALTTELIFRLVNDPANTVVKSVDLLDFPGYRSRQKLVDVSHGADNKSPVPSLLLRGKVAYLFERYTNDQEMNALVLCTSTFKQSEVVSVGKVLSDWVNKTQGKNPEERANHASGLIWTLTMSDGFVGQALNNRDPALFVEACKNMMTLTMVERFGRLEWMQQWTKDTPFNNTCMVRKPRLDTSFITLANGDEVSFTEANKDLLDKLGETFKDSELVNRHIADPSDAWQAMLELNDGGIGRFSSKVEKVANIDFKLERIDEQLKQRRDDILARLKKYYQEKGEQAFEVQSARANKIVKPFVQSKVAKKSIGQLLHYMALPDEHLRDLYLSGDFEAIENAKPVEPVATVDDSFDLFSGNAPAAAPVIAAAPELQSHEHRFATAVFQTWVSHLRNLHDRPGVLALLDIPRDVMEMLTDELTTCALRLDLPQQLSNTLLKRAQSGVRRDNLVQRQVLAVQLVLNDFTAWFGYLIQEAEDRPLGLLGNKGPLFAFYQNISNSQLPTLPPQVIDQSALFADDWLSGVAHQTRANAGHEEGRDIGPEQNAALGRVIKCIEG